MRPVSRAATRLLIVACGLAAPAQLPAQLVVERAELTVQLEPESRTLFAKSKLVLANRGREPVKLIELVFPAPFGSRIWVEAVWEERGELPWTSDPVQPGAPRTLFTGLRKVLPSGKKRDVVVHYQIDLKEFDQPNSAVGLSLESAWLRGAGWYPLPAAFDAVPGELTLTVRLPKTWTLEALVPHRTLEDGTRLASYELHFGRLEPGQVILRARAPRSSESNPPERRKP